MDLGDIGASFDADGSVHWDASKLAAGLPEIAKGPAVAAVASGDAAAEEQLSIHAVALAMAAAGGPGGIVAAGLVELIQLLPGADRATVDFTWGAPGSPVGSAGRSYVDGQPGSFQKAANAFLRDVYTTVAGTLSANSVGALFASQLASFITAWNSAHASHPREQVRFFHVNGPDPQWGTPTGRVPDGSPLGLTAFWITQASGFKDVPFTFEVNAGAHQFTLAEVLSARGGISGLTASPTAPKKILTLRGPGKKTAPPSRALKVVGWGAVVATGLALGAKLLLLP